MIIMSKYAKKIEDIFDYVVNRLVERKYIVVFLDEYYRSESALYQRKHLLHEILIYGCENDCLLYVGVTRNPTVFEMQECKIKCEDCPQYTNFV